jgi:predicted kinase
LHGRKDDASDADLRVLQAQLVYDIGSMTWSGIDVAGTPVDAESVARRLLVL